MTKFLRMLLVAALAISGAFVGGSAFADVEEIEQADNVQEGDNESNSTQEGSASSGDAVGGQVTGVVSSGDASVDATNESSDIDITTGTADGANDSSFFVGLQDGDSTITAADVINVTATNNLQEGDNSYTLAQAVDASSGDGVGGQVIGTVTSAGGSAAIVAQNASTEVDITTGNATANNDAAAFVGLSVGVATLTADVDNVTQADNVQEGDNDLQGSQAADAASGDGVGGQVLGVVSAGDAEVDATNSSSDVDLQTGNADSGNDAVYFVGLQDGDTTATAADITNVTATNNLQEGDNGAVFAQAADASSGDAVAGQVGGVVTSAGGSADLALDNTSDDVDGETGSTTFNNDDAGFVGQSVGIVTLTS